MDDKFFDSHKKRVLARLATIDRTMLPEAWWDTVIRHYYTQGFSVERTVQVILETIRKV